MAHKFGLWFGIILGVLLTPVQLAAGAIGIVSGVLFLGFRAGWAVVVRRPQPDAEALAAILHSLGAHR